MNAQLHGIKMLRNAQQLTRTRYADKTIFLTQGKSVSTCLTHTNKTYTHS